VQVAAEGIATDGTMGAAQTLNGTNVSIPQTLGSTVGNNLFHSFSDFNIDKGQIVTFTGTDNLQNVISRVTGDNKSIIDGTLKSEIKNADFYFINPNGITFNANASIDVPAVFHVTTADKMNFDKNGGVFFSDKSKQSQLSSESPVAFGFLGTSKVNNGLLEINGSQLSVKPDKEINLVAGNIEIKDGSMLRAATGEVKLLAIQGKQLVDVEKLPIQLSPEMVGGNIHIENNAVRESINTSGDGGGEIEIWGNLVTFDKANLSASNTGAQHVSQNENINIIANKLNINDSIVSFDSLSSGNGGNVNLTANQVRIDGQMDYAEVSSETANTGNGGTLTINSKDIVIVAGGEISTNAKSGSSGTAGNISLITKNLIVDGNGGVLTRISSQTAGEGRAGDIVIQTDNIEVKNGGEISSDTLPMSTESIPLEGIANLSDDLTKNKGAAGIVSIHAKNLTVTTGGKISSNSLTDGNAGKIQITADKLKIDGKGLYTEISSEAQHSGEGGEITVKAKDLTISEYGQITSDTIANGIAGNIFVYADNLYIDGKNHIEKTGISSDTSNFGKAGDVMVLANRLTLLNNGTISSKSIGADSSGKTGIVDVAVKNALILKNSKISMENAAVVDVAGEKIEPKPIRITADNISLNNSSITTQSTGNGTSGAIKLKFSTLNADHSFIETTAESNSGGVISLNGDSFINLKNSGLLTTVHNDKGNGGDIYINAGLLVMNTAAIQANADSGSGGNINLKLDVLIPSGNTLIKGGKQQVWQPNQFGFNLIQAASASGVSGNLNSSAPQMNLSGVLANINSNNFDTRLVSQDYCAVNKGSSLSKKGKGGLPLRAKDLQVF
jgi:filamentous hemagglutinin family protein